MTLYPKFAHNFSAMVRKTHVANAYKEDIYAKVVGKASSIGNFEAEVNAKGSVGLKVNFTKDFCVKSGLSCIAPDTHLAFDYGGSPEIVYVTIISQSGRVICLSLPIQENRSVIVDKDGYVKRGLYKMWYEAGDSEIWTDSSGVKHD